MQQEVIGKNVNMFMPSKTAMFHDGYMARCVFLFIY